MQSDRTNARLAWLAWLALAAVLSWGLLAFFAGFFAHAIHDIVVAGWELW